jgi:hypothetical protein
MGPECNPPPVSSSDEFNDPFSEDTGGGLLEMEGGTNIQDAKSAKDRKTNSISLNHQLTPSISMDY